MWKRRGKGLEVSNKCKKPKKLRKQTLHPLPALSPPPHKNRRRGFFSFVIDLLLNIQGINKQLYKAWEEGEKRREMSWVSVPVTDLAPSQHTDGFH